MKPGVATKVLENPSPGVPYWGQGGRREGGGCRCVGGREGG